MSHRCTGKPLSKCHDEVACHAQGEKRNETIKLLKCWVNAIENECFLKKQPAPDVCQGSLLCYPEFSCEKGTPVKRPLCDKHSGALFLANEERPPEWKRDKLPPPAWERPRVKSVQLIGGDFRKVKECFRANGLNDFDYCPRTRSCNLMQCLEEMVEEDRRIHGRDGIASDCCCRPGDAPSRMPQFKCHSCFPPKQHGDEWTKAICNVGSGEHKHHHSHPGEPMTVSRGPMAECYGKNPRNSVDFWP